MASTNAINQSFKNPEATRTRTLTVATGVTIYEGTLVSIDGSGNAVVAVTSARIAGIAKNTAIAGEIVTCYYGLTVRLNLSSVAATAVGATAYAADNDTATLSSNTAILGPVQSIETNLVWVDLTLRA